MAYSSKKVIKSNNEKTIKHVVNKLLLDVGRRLPLLSHYNTGRQNFPRGHESEEKEEKRLSEG
jgi:hypothetical protein